MNRSLAALLLILSACASSPPASAPTPAPATRPAPEKPAAEPAPAKPAAKPDSPKPAPKPAPKPLPAASGEVVFTPQPGWIVGKPASRMRKAQFTLSGKPGGDLELVIFHFGPGQGGTVEANVKRWVGQYEAPSRTVARAKTTLGEGAGKLVVYRVDVSGTYAAATRPRSPEIVRQEGSRMLAAVIVGGKGPYFVKLRGPAAGVAAWEASFDAFLRALRVAD